MVLKGAVYQRVHNHNTNKRLALKVINMPQGTKSLFIVVQERSTPVFVMKRQISGVIKANEKFRDYGRCFIFMYWGSATLSNEVYAYNFRVPLCLHHVGPLPSLSDVHIKGVRSTAISSLIMFFSIPPAVHTWQTLICPILASRLLLDTVARANIWRPRSLRPPGHRVVSRCNSHYLLLSPLPFTHADHTIIPDVSVRMPLPLNRSKLLIFGKYSLHRTLTVDPKLHIASNQIMMHSYFNDEVGHRSKEGLQLAWPPFVSLLRRLALATAGLRKSGLSTTRTLLRRLRPSLIPVTFTNQLSKRIPLASLISVSPLSPSLAFLLLVRQSIASSSSTASRTSLSISTQTSPREANGFMSTCRSDRLVKSAFKSSARPALLNTHCVPPSELSIMFGLIFGKQPLGKAPPNIKLLALHKPKGSRA